MLMGDLGKYQIFARLGNLGPNQLVGTQLDAFQDGFDIVVMVPNSKNYRLIREVVRSFVQKLHLKIKNLTKFRQKSAKIGVKDYGLKKCYQEKYFWTEMQ